MSLLSTLQGGYAGGRLVVTTSELGELGTTIAAQTGWTALEFDGMTAEPSQSGTTIAFSATTLRVTTSGLPIVPSAQRQVRVDVEIDGADDAPVLVLCIGLATAWRVSESLPQVAGTFWDDVAPAAGASPPPALVLATGPAHAAPIDADVATGWTLAAALDATAEPLARLGWLVGGAPRVAGQLDAAAAVNLDVKLPASAQKTLQDLLGEAAELEVALVDGQGTTPGASLRLGVQWAESPVRLEAAIPGLAPGVLVLALDGPLPLPHTLPKFMGGLDPVKYLPSALQAAIAAITVDRLELGVGLATQGLEYARVTLGGFEGHKLPVVDGITVDGITVTATAFAPLATDEWSMAYHLQGVLDLDGVDLLVTADLVPSPRLLGASFAVQVQLDEGTEIDLAKVASGLGLPPGAPAIVIDELVLGASSSGYTLVAELAVHEVGSGTSPLALERLMCAVEWASGDLSVDIQGNVSVAGANLLLELSNPGWHFSGATEAGDTIAIGALIDDLGKGLGLTVPGAIGRLVLDGLAFDYAAEAGEFTFDASVKFPLAGATLAGTVHVAHGPSTTSFIGTLSLAGQSFRVSFDDTEGVERMTATYDGTLALADVAKDLGIDLSEVPEELLPVLTGATLTYDFGTAGGALAIGAKTERTSVAVASVAPAGGSRLYAVVAQATLDVGLRDLPVVGSQLSDPATDVSVHTVDVVWLSGTPTPKELPLLRTVLQEAGGAPLPDAPVAGAALRVGIDLGGTPAQPLVFAVGGTSAEEAQAAHATVPPPTTARPGAWLVVQRSLGPLTLQRIGVAYAAGRVQLLLDAGFLISGFELDLQGLGAGFAPKLPVDVRPTLSGIAASLDDGPLQIGGGLLAVPGADPPQYDGALSVMAEQLTLTALASYTTVKDAASLFGFAVLDTPLGGPPAFYVTALAAGFAVNRDLVVPAIEDVPSFALVEAVNGGAPFGPKPDVAAVVQAMQGAVPPRYGESWLAVGVRATSFELVQSAALLVVKFGAELEVDVLGAAGVSVPNGDPDPIGYAELAIEASFRPADGVLAIGAQLTPGSYVLAHACHLTGGFALRTWFRDVTGGPRAGDCVVTLGGYHPAFAPPPGYPAVPRVGVNWQVSGNLVVKGDVYLALTPGAVMAGGELDATWSSGGIEAWFSAYADFLLGWRPFYYSANVCVSLGASFTVDLWSTSFTVNVHLGASLDFHGPPFAGEATVHLYVCSITIRFGDSDATPDPIPWSDFQKLFLPPPMSEQKALLASATDADPPPGAIATDSICLARVTAGLVKQLDKGSRCDWVVSAELLELTTSSVLPSTSACVVVDGDSTPQHGDWEKVPIGVGPVGVSDTNLDTSHQVTLTRQNTDETNGDLTFSCDPVTTNVPAATWSTAAALEPTLAGLNTRPRTIDGALTGLRLRPTVPVPDHTPLPISLEVLQYTPDPVSRTAPARAATPPTTDTFDQTTAMKQLQATLTDAHVAKRRSDILATLRGSGVDVPATVNVSAFAAAAPGALTSAPVLSLLGEERA